MEAGTLWGLGRLPRSIPDMVVIKATTLDERPNRLLLLLLPTLRTLLELARVGSVSEVAGVACTSIDSSLTESFAGVALLC